ncbi:MAG: glycosyltransferase family 4 protein [Bryobacterales bacterium]|jgi:alpha-1,3-rhamnosyl/mannosyltransferase|nr:glycosyltransferase family 4 protein [Bryobacterales bacterium]
MHIVLDGSPLTVASGGIRRYTMELARALSALAFDDQVTLLCDRPLVGLPLPTSSGIQVVAQAASGWRKRWWSLGVSSAARQLQASVFHGVDFTVPYLHRHPAVMTIHDLSPWRFPHWQPAASRIRRRTPWLLRLGLADMVITVSEAVRLEVLDTFRLNPDQVVAIPLAADACFRPHPPSAQHPDNSTVAKPYFLYVGTNEPRKNLLTLVEAWRQLPAPQRPELWIVGRMREDGFQLPLLDGLRNLGMAPDTALAPLYANALATMYPSVYEGFGLPVLEAMQCGSPVVVGDCPALRELATGAAILLPPDRVPDWRDAMQRVVQDAELRSTLRTRSLQRSAAFSWRSTAERTRLVYQEAIARFGR